MNKYLFVLMRGGIVLFLFSLFFFDLEARDAKDSLWFVVRDYGLKDSVKIDSVIDQMVDVPITTKAGGLSYTDSLIVLCNRIGYLKGEIKSQLLKADELKYLNQTKESLELVKEIFLDYDLQQHKDLLAAAYSIKGANYYDISQYSKSAESLLKAIDLGEKLGLEDLYLYYYELGLVYIDLKQVYKAKECFNKTYRLAIKSGKPGDMASGMYSLASAYHLMDEMDTAIHYFEMARSYYEKARDTVGIYDVISSLAFIEIDKAQYDEAIQRLQELLVYDLKVGAKLIISQDYQRLALCYFEKQEFNTAEKFIKKSLEYIDEKDFQFELGSAYHMLYEIESERENYKKALDYHIKYTAYYDSLKINESKEKITFIEEQFENRQQEAENKHLRSEQEKNRQIIKYQRVVEIFLLIALVFLFLVVITIVKQYMENKSLNTKLSKANSELNQINKSKDRLFSIISHDLKGPIGTLMGMVDLIMRNMEKGIRQDVVSRFMPLLFAELKTSNELIENLLNWSQAQFQLIQVQKHKLLIKPEVKGVVELLNSRAKEKKITILNQIDDDMSMIADPNILSALIRNLLSNAIKFTPIGGHVEVDAQKGEQAIQFSVKDSGVGITQEKQFMLLNKDEYYSTRGTENEKGVGLGLYLCKEFVELHGGRMWLESELGKGSTFYFSIPQPNV